jgi:hypothetical protein
MRAINNTIAMLQSSHGLTTAFAWLEIIESKAVSSGHGSG